MNFSRYKENLVRTSSTMFVDGVVVVVVVVSNMLIAAFAAMCKARSANFTIPLVKLPVIQPL
jgi:hypothetical protein